jgi:hypothetical protein
MSNLFLIGACVAIVGILLLVMIIVSIYLLIQAKKFRERISELKTQIDGDVRNVIDYLEKSKSQLYLYVEERERTIRTDFESSLSSRIDKALSVKK